MTNEEESLVEALIEEVEKIGSTFASTTIELHRNGKRYYIVIGLNVAREDMGKDD